VRFRGRAGGIEDLGLAMPHEAVEAGTTACRSSVTTAESVPSHMPDRDFGKGSGELAAGRWKSARSNQSEPRRRAVIGGC